MPVPDGYHIEPRKPVGLIAVGGLTLGAGYAVAIATGASSGFSNGEGWLAAPVLGPWGALGSERESPCDLDVGSISNTSDITATQAQVEGCVKDALGEAARLALIAADGVVQAFGAGMLLAGLAGGRAELVRNDLVPPKPETHYGRTATRPKVGLSINRLGRHGLLLGVIGRF